MKNRLFMLTLGLMLFTGAQSQKYFTKAGKITFNATTPSSPEKVTGVNRTATCVIDTKSGALQFVALMKGFEFERALMEEHFNENYVESDKYPRAEFKGSITNNAAVDYTKDGTYAVKVTGKMTIHGETHDVTVDGKIVIQGGKISAVADFPVKLEDYKISIPGLVSDKVAKIATINVNCSLELFKG